MIRILILAALVLAACNPQRYVLKQLDKHPEWASDTVTLRVTDTLVVPGYVHDTTFILDLSDSTDTLSVNNDTVRVTIARWRDRLHVRTEVKDRPVPYEKEIYIDRRVTVAGTELKHVHWKGKLIVLGLVLLAYIIGVFVGRVTR